MHYTLFAFLPENTGEIIRFYIELGLGSFQVQMNSFLYVEMICLVSVYRFHSEEMSYCIPESLFFSLGLCGGTALLFSQWRCKYNGNIQHDIDSYNYILTVIPKENVQNYNHNDTGWMQECFTILVFYYIGVLLYCFLGQIKHSWANLSYHRKCFFPNQVKIESLITWKSNKTPQQAAWFDVHTQMVWN